MAFSNRHDNNTYMLSVFEHNTQTMIDMEKKHKESNRAFHNEAIEVYKALFERYIGNRPVLDQYPKVFNGLNNILKEGYTKNQVLAMIFCHFEWRGPDGTNEMQHKNLIGHNFPISWINTRSGEYAAYIEKTITPAKWRDDKYMEELLDKWEGKLFVE